MYNEQTLTADKQWKAYDQVWAVSRRAPSLKDVLSPHNFKSQKETCIA